MTLFALGLGSILTAIIFVFSWWRIKHWPKIPSRIVSSSIESRRNPVGAGVVINEYRPRVEYEYEVRGRRFLGKRIGFRDSRLWTDCLEDAESGLFISGSEVMVSVSPINSQNSIIDTRVKLRDLDFLGMLMILGILIGGVGAWVATVVCL
jgi:hypothetical protein